MKLFKIIFILLIATTDISICLKTNELCRSNLKTCPVSFSHYCVQDYCAINKLACIDFQDLNKHMKLIKNKYSIRTVNSLIESIKLCPKKETWNSKHVCFKSFKCFKKNSKSVIKPTYCPCSSGKYKYNCDDLYCSIDKKSCEGLKIQRIMKQNSFFIKICGKYPYLNNFICYINLIFLLK